MGFAVVVLVVKAVLLVQLSLLLLSTFTVSAPIWPQASPPHYHAVSPVVPPSHPPTHHHHHHPHPHPHPHPPTKPPTPTPPPVHPPPKAPVQPPTKPPTSAPPKPPVQPPTKPPTKPPTQPPPKPPTQPPTKPPTKPPTQSPTKPPTHPPSHPPAKPPTSSHVAVQGVVYCKSCKYAGVDTLLGAKPIPRATVRLTCKDAKNELTVQFKTDKNGYFFLQAPITIYNFDLHNCSVSLVSSPLRACSKPSNLNGGLKGAPLKPEKPSTSKKLPYVLYSVGPFAFEPTCHKN
ncbi:hypothetical protein ERO13_D05G163801v2 [Gossypium hirsutum]|uniref:Non-classical arabinogalactan protein 31 n=5 Tax=Gossypium TaxID=3633 RepID=A0A1U8JI81_GOSHI|nr:non-classical arabinogalactan protein 31 [Gossypium hirsutum]KAB2029513.1 hypothetical protein ES319_D05G169100v1 [Gossypium barbadense]TYG68763.1 hypothetical protein ES288_D05G179000v1 [Gossypium darwinii]TYH71327.1 hypothetical protein ES332_D05G178400v1 [Gossypium tomentosum]TYI81742.1 hypothetical protein E1A91_D05G174900v1 [Gossypium mustelinum]KAG4146531.1 hypothetical protein ERO13_D05G163801v2 [Gossypium hirsutum]